MITDSVFNANTTADPHFIDDTGLIITSSGNVTLNNVETNDNRLIGATITAVGDVNIDSSSFSNNRGITLSSTGTPVFQGYGLLVVTQGSIDLVLVNASNNTLFGAYLQAEGREVSRPRSIQLLNKFCTFSVKIEERRLPLLNLIFQL